MTPLKLNFAFLHLVVVLGGCGTASKPLSESVSAKGMSGITAPAVVTGAPGHSAWAGRWIGVEGTFVDITRTSPGSYSLEMQSDLDTRGKYAGQDAESGIAFTRGNEEFLLRAATGDETGLKYLAGKQDCLMVKPGEGYCRANRVR